MEITPIDMQLVINQSNKMDARFEDKNEVVKEQNLQLDQNIKEEIEEDAKKTIEPQGAEESHINNDKEKEADGRGRRGRKKTKAQEEQPKKEKKMKSNISIFDVTI